MSFIQTRRNPVVLAELPHELSNHDGHDLTVTIHNNKTMLWCTTCSTLLSLFDTKVEEKHEKLRNEYFYLLELKQQIAVIPVEKRTSENLRELAVINKKIDKYHSVPIAHRIYKDDYSESR